MAKIRFELGGAYTPEEINDHEDVRSALHDKEIDAYLVLTSESVMFFEYWDTDERGRVYKYQGGQEKYDETFN